jgi:YesN/AraC family two-component response regulator
MKLPEKVRILIVDDEAGVRKVLEQVLQESGFEVTLAVDGREALKLFEENPFPLVITDLVMPEMDGIELLQSIKRLDPDTQVIIITSYASVETAVEALRCGAYDYLFKPFENIELVSAAARRALERIELENENRRLLAKLQDQKRELEIRVKARTKDLEAINQQLVEEIQERMRAQDAAEAASRARNEFLANMSHELRTPLNHIIGFAKIILSRHFGELNEVQREYLDDVLENGQLLLKIIDGLIDLSYADVPRPNGRPAGFPFRPSLSGTNRTC